MIEDTPGVVDIRTNDLRIEKANRPVLIHRIPNVPQFTFYN